MPGHEDIPSSHPAIRTMSSDIDELLKTSRPTISQMITQEAPQQGFERTGAPQEKKHGVGPAVIIVGALVIGGLVAGGVWYFLPTTPVSPTGTTTGTPTVPPGQTVPEPSRVPPPRPLFSTDASRTITVSDNDRPAFLKLVTDTLQEPEREGTIKRILIKLQKGQMERYANGADFFDLWHITPPQNFLQHLDPAAFMFFVYYGPDGPRIGFAAKTRDPDRTLSDIFFWEQTLVTEMTPFFFQEQIKQPDPPLFEDRAFSNTDWRYIKLSDKKDVGIGYLIFQASRLVVFTTSKQSMESVIKILYGTQ